MGNRGGIVPTVVESCEHNAARERYNVAEPKPIIDPQHWRDCAVIARAKADRVHDVRFKHIMLRIAEVYEGLAERSSSFCDALGATALELLRRDIA
jgi:hypothetical protein